MKPDSAKAAIKSMWVIADKHERLRTLLRITQEDGFVLTAEEFWSEFWRCWTSSENINDDHDVIPDLMEYGHGLGSPWLGLKEEDRATLEALPDRLTIYRGCVGWNREGYSWTMDRKVARQFADRAFCEQGAERYVLSSEIDKSSIVGYLSGRSESEIVIEPCDLPDLNDEEVFTKSANTNVGIFYAVQSGRMFNNNPLFDEARADMMATTINRDFDHIISVLDRDIAFSEWAGLTAKLGYFRAFREKVLARSLLPAEALNETAGFHL